MRALAIVLLIGCGASRPPGGGGDDDSGGVPDAMDPGTGGGDSGGGGGGVRTIEIYSGDGAMVMGGWPGGDALKVIVLDGSTPASGVTVNWQTTVGYMAMTAMAGEFQTGLVGSSVTDSNGIARVGLRGDFLSQMISAVPSTIHASIAEGSVDFSVWSTYWTQQLPVMPATYITEPGGIDLGTHSPGEVVTAGLEVLVAFQTGSETGRGMPGVGMRFTIGNDGTVDTPPIVSCANATNGIRTGGTVFTDATGTATCDIKVPTTPGQYSFGVFVGGASLHTPMFVTVQ